MRRGTCNGRPSPQARPRTQRSDLGLLFYRVHLIGPARWHPPRQVTIIFGFGEINLLQSPVSTSILAHDCRIGKKRLLKSIARTRADDALTLTAAMISPVDRPTGTASDRSPTSNSSSLIA